MRKFFKTPLWQVLRLHPKARALEKAAKLLIQAQEVIEDRGQGPKGQAPKWLRERLKDEVAKAIIKKL